MTDNKVYLKSNVVIEPLVDKWYAWSHLISPGTAAMNLLDRHITIMESYIAAPQVHAEAVFNPKMRGGPFMDYGGKRVDEVEKLLNKIKKENARQIEFGKALKQLDKMLMVEGKGFGLENQYEKIPDILRGYVELHYDRNNNAGYRFFESLLFGSEFYNRQAQSIALWLTTNDTRPFCLSTPRLADPNVLELSIPFDHPGIDALAEMKRVPQIVPYIQQILGVSDEQLGLFNTFFTADAPAPYEKYTGDKIRMRYFGHACILIETPDLSILIDPLISYYGYYSDLEHFSDADLPDTIDYVLITHNHQDHVLFETLLPLRHKTKNIIVPKTCSGKLEDPDLKLMFENIGFHNVYSIGEMEEIQFADATITGLPFTGEHSDLNILCKSCYLLSIDGFKLMFFADSRILEPKLYKYIQQHIGSVDVMFLGMECDGAPLSWLYGPLMTKKLPRDQDSSRRLAGSDCAKGISLVDIFNPKEVYVYAMGQEPWVEFISSIKYTDESNPIVQSNKMIGICRQRNIVAERLFGEKEILYNRQATASMV
ncbi:MAG TPA: MBL fold metallo-hydrolase [Puia sp.]|nr:MBL fold metallo-hydrolase [Puia sp.]